MSTRANILLTNEWGEKAGVWFYRHSDGYPSGTLHTLKIFCDWVREGKIRDNPSQAGCWLILIGAKEYNWSFDRGEKLAEDCLEPDPEDTFMGWKCGAYEPTFGEHGDIEFLYRINLTDKTLI